jgi:REP element-mobilizing transposase RayT
MPHTYSRLILHIVFSTKHRFPFITDQYKNRLYDYIGGTIRNLDGSLIEIGGVEDHVHILTGVKPTIAPSKFLQSLKPSVTNWAIKNIDQKFGWQDGFGAFSVSDSEIEGLRSYIQNQEAHHRRVSFDDEFVMLCKRNRLTIDQQYLWK